MFFAFVPVKLDVLSLHNGVKHIALTRPLNKRA